MGGGGGGGGSGVWGASGAAHDSAGSVGGMGARRGSGMLSRAGDLPAPSEAEETVVATSEAGAELLRALAADNAISDTLALVRAASGRVSADELVKFVRLRAKDQIEARMRARRLVAELRGGAAGVAGSAGAGAGAGRR
jgi:hypothetical protein